MKKTETVELASRLDSTDHGDGGVESADERWRTNGGVDRNGGADDEVGRTGEAGGSVERQGQTRTADSGSRRR